MTLFLMILHLAAVLAVLMGWGRGKLHIPSVMLLPVIFLPLWGPAFAAAAQLHYLGGEKADEEPGSGRFGITDEVYRNIRMEEGSVADVLPIEDVLADGTPVQRRNLLLSVLHSGPAPFVRPLRVAGVNDDTEVVHYAVTALVELRSEYAQRLAEMEARLQERPSDRAVLKACADLDEEYIKSGIPESGERMDRISHCRTMLEKLLQYDSQQESGRDSRDPGPVRSWQREAGQGAAPRRTDLLKSLGEMCLLQEDAAAAEEAGRALMQEAPMSEDGYLLVLRARAAAGDGRGISEIIETIRRRGMYLSPAAREQLAFWSE